MRIGRMSILGALLITFASVATAGPAGSVIRETAELVLAKFGRGTAGQTVDQVAEATAKVVREHGDAALPLLRDSGHVGFRALVEAGEKAPNVIRLYARKGDDAIWVISEPKKLAIFIRHGDSAADALLRHRGIADDLIGRHGDEAVGALNAISRQNAQRLSIIDEEGLLAMTPRSRELLAVVRKHGDKAMDFIWKNKGALGVAAVLGTFLDDPQTYISGAKELALSPVAESMVNNINWTPIIAGFLIVVSLPLITQFIVKAKQKMRGEKRVR